MRENFTDAEKQFVRISPPYIVRKGIYTFEEFLEISDEEGKWELSGGEIIIHSPTSFDHEEITAKIIAQIVKQAKDKGKVFGSNAVYHLSEITSYAPDVSFVSKERLGLVKEKYFEGSPDIVVEVISKSTKKYDVLEKLPKYQEAGVKVIVYVFCEEKRLQILRKGNYYQEETYTSGKINVMDDISLDLDELW